MAVVFLIYFTSSLSLLFDFNFSFSLCMRCTQHDIHAMCHSNCYNRSLIDKDIKNGWVLF